MRHLLVLFSLLALCSCDYLPSWMRDKSKDAPKAVGERISVLPSETVLAADSALVGVAPTLSPAVENDMWASHSGGMEHVALATTLKHVSDATVGAGSVFTSSIVPAPVVANGLVYAMDATGQISAHDVVDISRIKWSSKGVLGEDEQTMLAGGLAVDGSTLYAVSGDGLVAAFDALSGAERWRYNIKIPVRSAPRIANGKVFVVSIDSQLFALDVATGGLSWSVRGINEGSSYLAVATPAAGDGLVVAPFSSGEIKVLSVADGADVWSDTLAAGKKNLAASDFGGFGADPVVIGNALYAVSTSGALAGFRLDNGLNVWELPVASTQTPWVSGNALFVLTSDAQLLCINRIDGRVFWSATLPRYEDPKEKRDPYFWSGPVLAGGRLLVVGAHGEMKQFKPETGAEMESIEIPDEVYTAPVVAKSTLYLVRKNAELVEYK